MARTQFTFTFRNAEPGAAVTFSADVYSSPADQTADGPALVLDASRTVGVWADVSELTATWVDASGASIDAEASIDIPFVVETGGVAGGSPAPSGALYFLDLFHNSSASNYFGLESVPLKANGQQVVTASTPLMTIAPGGGICEVEMILPAFLGGTVDLSHAEISVSNAAGTEKTTWVKAGLGVFAASSDTFLDLATGGTTSDVVGTDLAWDSGFGGPVSTAGGQFTATVVLLLTNTALA